MDEKNCNDRRKMSGLFNLFRGSWKFMMDGIILAAVLGTFGALWTQNADIAVLKVGVGELRTTQEKRDVTWDRLSTDINKINNNIDKISFKLDFLQSQVQRPRVSVRIDSVNAVTMARLKARFTY